MGEKSYPITVEQFQEGIELLCPCMDDYLYLYDFKKDYYYISSHALDRFVCRQMLFMMTKRRMKNLCIRRI